MTARKEDVIGAIRGAQEEVERLLESAPEGAWSKGAYERGWNAKQLLCHVAASSSVAGLLLAMARNPGATFGGGPDEARGHLERDFETVNAASDQLLASHYRAPWGYEGPLADVILDSLRDHLMMHLRDLGRALG